MFVKKKLCSFIQVELIQNQSQEENAIKAKLRRLCEAKKNGKLQVPEWMHNEWRNGDHLRLAREFQACGFNKATGL